MLKIFKQFKIKSDRKGPSISATLFKPNTYLIGNDNSLWKIEKGKWTKVETIKTGWNIMGTMINLKIYNTVSWKISAIGSYNMNGICYNISNNFIDLFGDKKQNNKYNKIYNYLRSIL